MVVYWGGDSSDLCLTAGCMAKIVFGFRPTGVELGWGLFGFYLVFPVFSVIYCILAVYYNISLLHHSFYF